MYTSIVILVVIASLLMCGIVLIQESKGGGLAADYSSGNTLLGAPKTTNVIEKATWTLAAAMVVLSVLSVKFLPGANSDDSVMQQNAVEQSATNPNNVPGMTQTSTKDANATKQTPTQQATEKPAEEAPTE